MRASSLALVSAAFVAGCSAPNEEIYVKPRQEALKASQNANYQHAEEILTPLVKTMSSHKARSTGNAMQQLAWTLMLDGRYKEAEDVAAKAKYEHEQSGNKDSENRILDDYTLATIYLKDGKFDQAEPLFREAIELKRDVLKLNSAPSEPKIVSPPPLAALELELGKLEIEMNRLREADATLKEALKLAEDDNAAKKENSKRILALVLEQTAALKQSFGQVKEAENICKRGMKIIREQVSPNQVEFLSAVGTLMGIYREQYKYGLVDRISKSLWPAANTLWRPEHPEILRAKLMNMAGLPFTHDKNSAQEIQSVHDRIIADYVAFYGADNVYMVAPYEIAGEYSASVADFEKAEASLRAALAIAQSKLGAKKPRTLNIQDSLALVLAFKGMKLNSPQDMAEAKKLVREVIAYSSDLPPGHPLKARSLGTLGSIYTLSDDHEAAYRTFHAYLAATKVANNEDPHEKMRFLRNFRTTLAKLGHHTEEKRITQMPIYIPVDVESSVPIDIYKLDLN